MAKLPLDNYTVELLQKLLRYPSITPEDVGIMSMLQSELEHLGFKCHLLEFEEPEHPPVLNLYARLGSNAPNLCFAGHVDVVPPGDVTAWSEPPFAGHFSNNKIYGRGAVDMKGAIAAFIGALRRYLSIYDQTKGSISLLLTGDEEGVAINGTTKALDWLKAQDESINACLVGEPTSSNIVGDTIKIGRRGSANFDLKIYGVQGHVAYPELANNPVTSMITVLHKLQIESLDLGTEIFAPSNLEVTSIDVGNLVSNVIPAMTRAQFNIRFNNLHTAQTLLSWVHSVCSKYGMQYDLNMRSNAEAFITKSGNLRAAACTAINTVILQPPLLSTSGGTSDARFIHHYCETLELGLCNALAHKIDEHVTIEDLLTLEELYYQILTNYFKVKAAL